MNPGYRPWDGADDGDGEPEPTTLLFTLGNPEGSVWVSAELAGNVHGIELAPSAASMTERQLAEEVRTVAVLAQRRARSALHALVLQRMTELGHDRHETAFLLEHASALPSPEAVHRQIAAAFADRHTGDRP